MPKPTQTQFAQNIAALVFAIGADESYPEGCNAHITPDGAFRSDDGRPASLTSGLLLDWQMSADIAAALIAGMAATGKPILYDYEHNSQWGDSRAAGWIDKLVHVPGRGLFAHVEWTPDAAEDIAKKVYRYSSPLFMFDVKTGAVTKLLSVALTNNPALGNLGAVELTRRAALHALPLGALAQQFLTAGAVPGNPHGDPDMPLTPEEVAALTVKSANLETQLAALTTERDGLKTQLAALTKERDDLKATQAQAALTAELAKKDELIAAATSGDKPLMTPAQAEAVKGLPLAELTKFIETLNPVPLTNKQSAPAGAGGHGLSQEELAMCSKMGVTPEQFAETKKSQAR